MKRLLFVILAIALLAALAACGENTTGSTSDQSSVSSASSKVVSSTATASVKINVTVPEGWTANEGSAIDAHYMKDTASFMAKKEPLFSAKDLDGIAAEAKSIFSKTFTNVKYEGENKKLTVGGKKAIEFTFTAEVSKLKMKYRYVYVLVDSTVYALTFGDMESTFGSHSADYDTIISSITFK